MIRPYLVNSKTFDQWSRHSFVALIEWRGLNQQNTIFAAGVGSSRYKIEKFIDPYFGIAILERVFDPSVNRLESVQERQLVGDVLASSRFYRRARALAFEDLFGKFFQKINVRLKNTQVKKFFPSIADAKGKKLRSSVTVTGSSSLDIQSKLELATLLRVTKDALTLFDSEPSTVFNSTVLPVDEKRETQTYKRLNHQLIEQLADAIVTGDAEWEKNLDFVHRDFESFFRSSKLIIEVPRLTVGRKHRKTPVIEIEDIYSLKDKDTTRIVRDHIAQSNEWQESEDRPSLVADLLHKASIHTENEEAQITTSGGMLDYLQVEMILQSDSFFYLDSRWYRLTPRFGRDLDKKFLERVVPLVRTIDQLPKWESGSETEYNELFDSKVGPLYLHKVMADNVEICDALIPTVDGVYIVHVKDGLGASVRDLASQLFMAARIVEEEIVTGAFPMLGKLYQNAVARDRIDQRGLPWEKFVTLLKRKRVYCAAMRPKTLSEGALKEGRFASRIAKFSLVELATSMNGMAWDMAIAWI